MSIMCCTVGRNMGRSSMAGIVAEVNRIGSPCLSQSWSFEHVLVCERRRLHFLEVCLRPD